jgi:hypothetical protein
MKRFHDWYLRVIPTTIDLIQARFPAGTFGGPTRKIIFDFNDVQTFFHLGAIEMNLIRTWCLQVLAFLIWYYCNLWILLILSY